MFDHYRASALRGAYAVGQTARLVARYHYVEAQLMRVAAGRLAELETWEVKCLIGRHLWQDSLHAQSWLDRLVDLRWPRKASLDPGRATIQLLALLDAAPTEDTFLRALYRTLKPRLVAGYTAHLNAAAPLADEPTCILLQQTSTQEQEQIAAGTALLDTLPAHERGHEAWMEAVEVAATAVGSFGLPADDVGREEAGHFEGQAIRPAPAVAARDARFGFAANGFDRVAQEPGEAVRLMAHRDADNEMHAAEVLGRNLYEHPEMPWQYHVDMARQCWDEVRHAVLYQKYLEEHGGRLGDYPIVPGNYAYRMSLDFPHRLYDLHLRGEKLGMPDLIRMRDAARRAGDDSYAILNDYVHADEVPHVKNGRWLHQLLAHDRTAYERVERETMQFRAAYEQGHPDDPLLQAYTGLSQAVLKRNEG